MLLYNPTHLLSQFIFDFLSATTGVTTGAGGRTVAATPENFPALIGNGVAMSTYALLNPFLIPLG